MKRRRFLGRLGTTSVGVSSLAMRTVAVGSATVGGVATVAGCLDEGYDIGMTADGFVPDELTVAVGETVIWENTSSRRHTVTAYEGGIPDDAEYFASGGFSDERSARTAWHDDFGGQIDNGERYSHTFEVPGRYDYVCIPHEDGGMYATVFVEA